MGKKSSTKKVRKESENFETSKIDNLEIKENEKISIPEDISSKELNRYEKIKEYRDLKNINISYGDGEKDKFKDFQKIYSLVSKEIEVQEKK